MLGHGGRLVREAFVALLAREPDLDVVAQSANADGLLAAVSLRRPTVVLVDGALPSPVPAAELCAALVAAQPGCGVLVVLDHQSCAGTGAALARLAPRVGLIATDASAAGLVEGVRRLARGQPVLDAEVAVAALTAGANPLTERERDVLRLAVDGAPTKEIARKLFLSAGTVRNYISRAVAKTGGRSRIEAIRLAQEAGWI
ncbi:MAG TPA: response regulator transcription factor [Pilimelia sp.]|nr:response regulator transcription factor [Pilimelia sp.]